MPVFRRDGRNILFIHVPKCGGSSVEHAFRSSGYQAQYLDGKIGPGSINSVRSCTPQHMHAALLKQIFVIDRFDAVFMLVRDPLARFRSEYVWRHRDSGRISADAADVTAWASATFRRYRRDPYLYDNHIRPQHEFWLPSALVYRLEDGLDAMYADLNRRFDLDVSADPVRVRDGEGDFGLASRDVEVSDRVRARVHDFYRADYVKFGYGSGVGASVVPVADRMRSGVLRAKKRLEGAASAVLRRRER